MGDFLPMSQGTTTSNPNLRALQELNHSPHMRKRVVPSNLHEEDGDVLMLTQAKSFLSSAVQTQELVKLLETRVFVERMLSQPLNHTRTPTGPQQRCNSSAQTFSRSIPKVHSPLITKPKFKRPPTSRARRVDSLSELVSCW